MNRTVARSTNRTATVSGPSDPSGFEALIEPSRIFAHPRDVLEAPNLNREEKRAILASWASDVWAVESAPGLRHCPGLAGCQVPLDAVLEALRSLDPEPAEPAGSSTETWRMSPGGRLRARIRWLAPGLSRVS